MAKTKKTATATAAAKSAADTQARRGSSVIRWKEATIHGIRVKVAENFPDPITRWKRDAEEKQKAG